MKQTQEQIEHLRTIRETSSFWADVAENQLPTLAEKIDNLNSKIDMLITMLQQEQ